MSPAESSPASKTSPHRFAVAGLQCVAGALLLLWPAIMAGRPTAFPDTLQYLAHGRYLATWLGWADGAPIRPDPYGLAELRGHAPVLAATLMGARSVSYSAFLYLATRLGGLWAAAGLQALAAAWTCRVLARTLVPSRGAGVYFGLMASLSVLSSLPYFAGFLTPDLFASCALVLAALLLCAPERLSIVERRSAVGLLALFASTHGSIPLTLGGVVVLAAVVMARRGAPALAVSKRCAPTALALIAAMAGGIVYLQVARLGPAGPLTAPPFLTARVLEDQGGAALLAKVCTHPDRFAVCRFRGEPLDRSEDVIWSPERGKGVFLRSDYALRRRMGAEDARFALAAVMADPARQVLASVGDAERQLISLWIDDPTADPALYLDRPMWKDAGFDEVVADSTACRAPGACRSPVPVLPRAFLPALSGLVLGALLIGRLIQAARPGTTSPAEEDLKLLCGVAALMLAGLAINAVVCGAISGPFARYQARMIWLPPALAILAAARPAGQVARMDRFLRTLGVSVRQMGRGAPV